MRAPASTDAPLCLCPSHSLPYSLHGSFLHHPSALAVLLPQHLCHQLVPSMASPVTYCTRSFAYCFRQWQILTSNLVSYISNGHFCSLLLEDIYPLCNGISAQWYIRLGLSISTIYEFVALSLFFLCVQLKARNWGASRASSYAGLSQIFTLEMTPLTKMQKITSKKI